jgi:hypothetical protein
MYDSLIKIIQGEARSHLEDRILETVHRYVIEVNKEELVKALKYDRNQYESGYLDAVVDAITMVNSLSKGETDVGTFVKLVVDTLSHMKPVTGRPCDGCKFSGSTYDDEFPCNRCIRKNQDYYTSIYSERGAG